MESRRTESCEASLEKDRVESVSDRQFNPTEVETALLALGLVKEAVVVIRKYADGSPRVVAYVASAIQPAPTPSELWEALTKKLPERMVPTAYVVLDTLPRAPGGAVDRDALPAPYAVRPGLPETFTPPRDPLEKLLTEVWEECLNVRPVGTTDHFLELGGDSLLAVRMVRAVEERIGRKLRPQALLTGGTVKELAAELLRSLGDASPAQLVEVQAGNPDRRLFFLHGDFNGGGFYCVNLARHLGKDQAFYALQPHGLTEPQVPQTIEDMAADHLSTLFTFQPEGPYLLGGHCNGALIVLEMAHELRRRGKEVEQVLLISPPRITSGQSLASLPYLGPVLPGPGGGQPRRIDLTQLPHEERRAILQEIYRRACGRYQFRPYPGRVIVAEAAEYRAHVNWSHAAPAAKFAIVRGNHFTMLTHHVQDLAAVLRKHLDAARSAPTGEQAGSRP